MCKLVAIKSNYGTESMVADIKKDFILNIIDKAPLCKYIEKIVLFGSSIEERCTDNSDIDIAVFGEKTPGKVLTSPSYRKFAGEVYKFNDYSQDYDILYFKNGSKGGILDSISKGAVIYKRG